MIKRINVKQIRKGMYIHELECSWLYHPFARNQFKITDAQDLKKIITAGIKHLKIDTSKGLDVLQQAEKQTEVTQIKEVKAPATETETKAATSNENNVSKKIPARPLSESRKEAKNIKSLAEAAISSVMHDVKLGKQLEIESVSPVIDSMTESVLENHNTLLGLSRIRNQDAYTFEHSVNIGVLMMSFAKSKDMSKEVIQEVGVGGLLHDIGKTLTPPEVLNKPGKLTDEEFVIMRRHVVDSRLILEKVTGISKNALDVAALHHEKYDGTGYPNGFKGNEVSEIARMATIVDVYDALTADRCYHQGQDPSVVLKRMLSWSGSHFDPTLVQQFIQCVGIYPPATLVKLNNEHLAVVAENHQNLLTPDVVIMLNIKNHSLINPERIELSRQEKIKIVCSESDSKWKVDPQRYLDIV